MNQSKKTISDLSDKRSPDFNNETLFLKVLKTNREKVYLIYL